MGHTLRVASYNLRDLKDDADAAARVVRAINPDVLCLQEVPRHLMSTHRIALFAARCGLYWSGGHRGSGGTTLMSSLWMDVTGVQHNRLKVARLQRERGYAVSQVRLPGHPAVTLFSVHLSLDASDERQRRAPSSSSSCWLGSRRTSSANPPTDKAIDERIQTLPAPRLNSMR
jgi:endonuclease/exonuclease/phosphatase family metal-dependent hydrolase